MARKKKQQAVTVTATTKSSPGPKTSAAIRRAKDKHDELPLRPFLALEEGVDGTKRMASAHSDEAGHSAWLMSTLGTTSASFLVQQMNSLEVATAGTSTGDQPNVGGLNAALALIGAIDPKDELEGALATQMVGCHALSMAMLCRAKSTNNADHLQLYGNMAVKLQRTFTAQIEALARLRGKGQQTVRVEHVTVAPGGQAIVGDIHHYGRGAGLPHEIEDQSHAAGNFSHSSALPSPNQIGDAVPVPGRERPEEVQDARGHEPRRTGRKSKCD